MTGALIVFGKAPSPGHVKTRLMPPLAPEEAADLYRAFLEDAIEQYDRLGVDVRLYLAGMNTRHVALEKTRDALPQRGDGLGERMLHAFAETFAAGYGRAVIIGTDHPTLPSAFIEKAFELLEEPQSIVLGPAADGGYYLLGMNDLRPALFRGMSYSHGNVFDETLARASEEGGSVAVLPEWYDVDTPEALRRLSDELQGDPDVAPRTRRVLDKLHF